MLNVSARKLLCSLIFVAAPSAAHAAEIDLYLTDDFTDRGCAKTTIVSTYQPMLGYDKSMAAQIDSYLGEDFSNRVAVTNQVISTYMPLEGYATQKH
jgi:hypothetical protein